MNGPDISELSIMQGDLDRAFRAINYRGSRSMLAAAVTSIMI